MFKRSFNSTAEFPGALLMFKRKNSQQRAL
jgi:hypothetical protein